MWDDLINDVARRLTAAPPPPDLRRRVLDRIATGNRRPFRRPFEGLVSWNLPASMAGLAVAAIVCIALFAAIHGTWHSGPTPAPVTAVRPGSTATPPADVPMAATSAISTISQGAAVTSAAARSTRTGRVQELRQGDGDEVELDAIAHLVVAPLTVDGVRVDQLIPPDPIELGELSVTPLSVTPLAPEDRPRD